jgi:hypothetical protein
MDCNSSQAPMEPCMKLSKQSAEPAVDHTTYRSIVGGLMYLVNIDPNLGFVVGYVSWFLEDSREETMKHTY